MSSSMPVDTRFSWSVDIYGVLTTEDPASAGEIERLIVDKIRAAVDGVREQVRHAEFEGGSLGKVDLLVAESNTPSPPPDMTVIGEPHDDESSGSTPETEEESPSQSEEQEEEG